MSSLLDPALERIVATDRHYLHQTQVPIITVSATFQEDLKGIHGFDEDETIHDIVFSRAHYSMALALLVEAWGIHRNQVGNHPLNEINRPEIAWMVDPANYVTANNWKSLVFTEQVGKLLARVPVLKKAKDLIDTFGRSKLPILDSITPPLLYLTQGLDKPILSFHIATGNILHDQGHTILQVITDPHVRPEYAKNASSNRMYYAVFDEKTQYELMEIASLHGKYLDPNRVIVTGPPVDPRLIAMKAKKHPWRNGPLKLCLTTGGIGTNKTEIKHIVTQLIPELRKRPSPYQLLVYAGTQTDIATMVTDIAKKNHIRVAEPDESDAPLRLLYHPQIVDANELLLDHAFPWADGFISKPSGDMAYDVAVSGSFLLTLQEWGEWEHEVRAVFEQRGISRKAEVGQIVTQLEALTAAKRHHQSWVERAMNHAHQLEPIFYEGTKNILAAYRQIAE